MDLNEFIRAGLVEEITFPVEERQTASQIGSGSLRVLATPAMIAFMESVSLRLLARYLPAGYSSVGVEVNVRHLAPTPVGSTVRVRSEVKEVNGGRVKFEVSAWDFMEQIGEGQHERVVIEEARFLRRVTSKADQLPSS